MSFLSKIGDAFKKAGQTVVSAGQTVDDILAKGVSEVSGDAKEIFDTAKDAAIKGYNAAKNEIQKDLAMIENELLQAEIEELKAKYGPFARQFCQAVSTFTKSYEGNKIIEALKDSVKQMKVDSQTQNLIGAMYNDPAYDPIRNPAGSLGLVTMSIGFGGDASAVLGIEGNVGVAGGQYAQPKGIVSVGGTFGTEEGITGDLIFGFWLPKAEELEGWYVDVDIEMAADVGVGFGFVFDISKGEFIGITTAITTGEEFKLGVSGGYTITFG
jgi:hypothetical protein